MNIFRKSKLKKNGITVYKIFGISSKTKLKVETPVKLKNMRFNVDSKNEETFIGAYTDFMSGTVYSLGSIGRYCSIAPNVIIGPTNHPTAWLSTHTFQYHNKIIKELPGTTCEWVDKTKPPVIGNDVWIGENAIIMRDVVIGDGAIIASGAVITKDVPPYHIVGGVPAKTLKKRFDNDTIETLIDIKWWNYSPEQFKGINFSSIEGSIKELQKRIKFIPVFKPELFTITKKGVISSS
ncbi:MAG: CatB-related O-acetyltransferase [Thermodesulfobacteriota bacterium]